jgi:hypothetical protein
MHRLPLLQGSTQRTMQTVLQVEVTAPGHHVGEQVAVEGGVLLQQRLQIKGPFGGDQLIEANLVRSDGGPLLLDIPMVGVRPDITHALENHADTLASADGRPEHGNVTISPRPGGRGC